MSFAQLVLGDKVDVPTLIGDIEKEINGVKYRMGKAKMTIPAGTKSGKVFRLRGQGLPEMNSPSRMGAQHVHVLVEVPSKVNSRQRELLEEFAKIEDEKSGNKSFFEKITGLFN